MNCHNVEGDNCDGDLLADSGSSEITASHVDASGEGLLLNFLGLPTKSSLQSTLVSLIQEVSELSFTRRLKGITGIGRGSYRRNLSLITHRKRHGQDDDVALPNDDDNQEKLKWDSLSSHIRWMRTVKLHIEAAIKIAHLISVGHSVIVQNREGKDAVTVVVSLAQVAQLDSFHFWSHSFIGSLCR